jgi:predicted Zn-dependent protease
MSVWKVRLRGPIPMGLRRHCRRRVALALNTGGAFTRAGSDVGAIAYATDFEREVDYVGAYYAARAGYDVAGVERFWRALAQENPKQVAYAGLHPTTPERFVQMQKTVAEISDKKRRNAALVPERLQAPVQTVAERTIGAE